MASTEQERWWAATAIVCWTLLVVASSYWPNSRLWGLNHLAFLPQSARFVFAAIMLGALIGVLWLSNRRMAPGRIGNKPGGSRLLLIVVPTWVVAAYLARAATRLLGDGYLRCDEVERGTGQVLTLTELLPTFLMTHFQRGFGAGWGLSGMQVFTGFSILAGVLFVSGTIFLWPHVTGRSFDDDSTTDWTSSLWLLTGGFVVLFFGYVETYALGATFLALLTLSILAHTNGRIGWGWPVVFWLLAFWSHLVAVAWAPAMLIVIYRRGSLDGIVPRVVSAVVVAGSIVTLWALSGSGTPFAWEHYLLPFTGASYTVFDWRHWTDVVNHIALMAPAALLLLLPGSGARATRWPRVWIWLAGPSLGFLLLFAPAFGWARDWDLYALASIPAAVILFVQLAICQERWLLPRRIAAVAIALSSLVAWIWVHADEEAAVMRFQYLVDLDDHNGPNGQEMLARYWREHGRWDLAVDELGVALQKYPHARLAVQRGIGWAKMGTLDSALVSFENAIQLDPMYADAFFGAGQARRAMGRADESLPYLQNAVALDSLRPDFRYHLGMCLSQQNLFDMAIPHLSFAAQHGPSNPTLINAWATALFESGDYDRAIDVLSSDLSRHPENTLGYTNLAWALYRRGDVRKAHRQLAIYEQRVSPIRRVGPAVQLRGVLDSVLSAPSSGTKLRK